jgi:hypothetical protein
MPSILDGSPEAIERNLKATGRTMEQLKSDLGFFDKVVEDSDKTPTIARANPELEHKFTMNPGLAKD